MQKEIKPGVWLMVLPTTQFKTTRINIAARYGHKTNVADQSFGDK